VIEINNKQTITKTTRTMEQTKTTTELFKVYLTRCTEYDDQTEVKKTTNMLTYSTFEKAFEHLEIVKALYNGRLYEDGIWSHVIYEDKGKAYMEDIRELYVY
jgi:GMP synthase PP-ATPase subunit